jgi:hypothetical protein
MYKEKYLKYKTKYLDLKNQLGGARDIITNPYPTPASVRSFVPKMTLKKVALEAKRVKAKQ